MSKLKPEEWSTMLSAISLGHSLVPRLLNLKQQRDKQPSPLPTPPSLKLMVTGTVKAIVLGMASLLLEDGTIDDINLISGVTEIKAGGEVSPLGLGLGWATLRRRHQVCTPYQECTPYHPHQECTLHPQECPHRPHLHYLIQRVHYSDHLHHLRCPIMSNHLVLLCLLFQALSRIMGMVLDPDIGTCIVDLLCTGIPFHLTLHQLKGMVNPHRRIYAHALSVPSKNIVIKSKPIDVNVNNVVQPALWSPLSEFLFPLSCTVINLM